MKRIILVFSIMICVLIATIIIYTNFTDKEEKNSVGKIKIIATLFPQYDFAKAIGKDKIKVDLLLPSGVESHDYEPTAEDYVNINKSDIFIYTGSEMEPWAEKISSSITGNTYILDASQGISYINEDHDKQDEHDLEELEHDEGHHHERDPHVWLDINNACIMVDNIVNCLSKVDSENAEYYFNNAEEYKKQLLEIDSEISDLVKTSKRNRVAFGGTFSYSYFINRYGLEYISAYDSCTDSVEPSVSKINKVMTYIKENEIPVVFYPELSNGKVAKMIANETNAKAMVFNSIHNVTEKEIEQGVKYLSLMRENVTALRTALN